MAVTASTPSGPNASAAGKDGTSGRSKTRTANKSSGKRSSGELTGTEVLQVASHGLGLVQSKFGLIGVKQAGEYTVLILPKTLGVCNKCANLRESVDIEDGLCKTCRSDTGPDGSGETGRPVVLVVPEPVPDTIPGD